MYSAKTLSKINDERRIVPLISALKDREMLVRQEAAESLGNVKDPRSVSPLIALLDDPDAWVRSAAESSLGKIGKPALDPLFSMLSSQDMKTRKKGAHALTRFREPSARDRLAVYLNQEDLLMIVELYTYFIGIGNQGSEPILIKALNRHGDSSMATAFINSGNKTLEEAGRDWASRNGYTIMPFISSSSSGRSWGRLK